MSGEKRNLALDWLRVAAIFVVFLAHVVTYYARDSALDLLLRTLSPGLTMSVLGVLSGLLLADRNVGEPSFLFKRLLRIFVPVWIMIAVMTLLLFVITHQVVVNQDLILHALGLSLFFDVFDKTSRGVIGEGLWFITAIVVLYVLLPVIKKVLQHSAAVWHLVALCAVCVVLQVVIYESQSFYSVAMGFLVGAYLALNPGGKLAKWCLPTRGVGYRVAIMHGVLASVTMGVVWLSTSGALPALARDLAYAAYPFLVFPLLHLGAHYLSGFFSRGISRLSEISFEFYLFHFYVINVNLLLFSMSFTSIYHSLLIGGVASLCYAHYASKLSQLVSARVDRYMSK